MDALATRDPLPAVVHASLSRPTGNLVELILERARRAPGHPALVAADAAGERVLRYGELAERVAAYAAAIRRWRIAPRARVLLLVRPDLDVIALALAVIACGRTLVLVDGRRGLRQLLAALADADADAIVGPPALMQWWPLVPALRRARRFASLDALLGAGAPDARHGELRPARVDGAAPAIVSFSSGNTGRAKAVVRTHGVLVAQHEALARAFPLDADDVNLPGFPVAAIHNLCCGTTTVLPAADLRSMADADPRTALALVERCGVTSLSGAPAWLGHLAGAVIARRNPLTRIRRIVVGGGAVGRALAADLLRAFPRAAAHVVYGASEAEPIASAPLHELLDRASDDGFLVGRPAAATELRLAGDRESFGDAGEIAVRGPQVAGDGGWHRTGDVGRLDADGRLWLLGRVGAEVVHEGRVLHPFVVEAVALAERGVRAAALVAHRGAPEGELLVEPRPGADADALVAALRAALGRRGLATLRVRRCDAIPMDARHASKVARDELRELLAWEGR